MSPNHAFISKIILLCVDNSDIYFLKMVWFHCWTLFNFLSQIFVLSQSLADFLASIKNIYNTTSLISSHRMNCAKIIVVLDIIDYGVCTLISPFSVRFMSTALKTYTLKKTSRWHTYIFMQIAVVRRNNGSKKKNHVLLKRGIIMEKVEQWN